MKMKRARNLEETRAIWCSPALEEVVFSSGDEPLAGIGELERENAALMQL